MDTKNKIFLGLIILFFLFTRLYKITQVPSSVYWDEASIGYNAYSIATTGRDEWGKLLPIHFRAFGEFKLPVFIYTTAIFVKILGLNELAIRLSSVLYSLGVVILTYLLTKKITANSEIGIWSSFFVSISSWLFIFSRTGYEATAGLMFYLLGIYLFLGNNFKNRNIFLSLISFILSAYSYNSFRVLIPLTAIVLVILAWKNLILFFKKRIINAILIILLIALSLIPIYRLYKYDAGVSRFQAVGSINSSIIPNYLSHFSFNFLFLNGDKNLRSQQYNFGQLYLFEAILIILGVFYIFGKKGIYFLPVLLLMLGPIPAAITKESPHALRSISMVPFFGMLDAFGVMQIKKMISQKAWLNGLVIVIALLFFLNYFKNFLYIYPIESSMDWQYGYKQIFVNYKNQFSKYDHVIISDQYAQPYIFGLFYLQYPSQKFVQQATRNSVDKWGFSSVASFNNFIFNKIDSKIIPLGDNLVFATAQDKLINQNPINEIKNLDNSVAFYVYEYKK